MDELVVVQIRHQLNEHFPTKHDIPPESVHRRPSSRSHYSHKDDVDVEWTRCPLDLKSALQDLETLMIKAPRHGPTRSWTQRKVDFRHDQLELLFQEFNSSTIVPVSDPQNR